MTGESTFFSQHPKLEGKVGRASAILTEPRAVPKSPEQEEKTILLVLRRAGVEQRSGTASPKRHTVSFLRSKESFRPRKLAG